VKFECPPTRAQVDLPHSDEQTGALPAPSTSADTRLPDHPHHLCIQKRNRGTPPPPLVQRDRGTMEPPRLWHTRIMQHVGNTDDAHGGLHSSGHSCPKNDTTIIDDKSTTNRGCSRSTHEHELRGSARVLTRTAPSINWCINKEEKGGWVINHNTTETK
jgi:hypothetical protein